MISLAHTLVSLPFGVYFSNPLLIFALAFGFHLLTDTILHWNFDPRDHRWSTYTLITAEALTGLVLSWVMLGPAFWTIQIWAAIAGGNAPDLIHFIWYFFTPAYRERWPRWAKSYFIMHEAIQLETNHIVTGLIPQVILIGVSLLLIWH